MSTSKDAYESTIDPRVISVERTLSKIERELTHPMDAVERVAVTRALEELGNDWAYYGRKVRPW